MRTTVHVVGSHPLQFLGGPGGLVAAPFADEHCGDLFPDEALNTLEHPFDVFADPTPSAAANTTAAYKAAQIRLL